LLGQTGGPDLIRQARDIAAEICNGDDLLRAYMQLCFVLAENGDLDEAAAAGLEGVGVARQLGLAPAWALLAANTAEALARIGRTEEALALTLDEDFLAGTPYQVSLLLVTGATIELRLGHLQNAGRILAEAEGLTAHTQDPQQVGMLSTAQAELAVAQGDFSLAIEAVESGLGATGGPAWVRLTAELCALGLRGLADRAEAASGMPAHDPQVDREPADRFLNQAREAMRLLGAGAVVTAERLALGMLCEAECTRLARCSDPNRWDEAAAGFERGHPYLEAYARFRQAEALVTGRRSRAAARDALRCAHAVATRLSAWPLVRRIESLAELAHLPVASPAPDEAHRRNVANAGLTSRELEVAALLVAGCSDQEIADRLFISRKTASVHVSNIVRKLGVSNRIDAARLAARLGLG
jgi:DNA-binding CsgD family transcriptional regulator/tetratricopeptide (TPR) repeat protein